MKRLHLLTILVAVTSGDSEKIRKIPWLDKWVDCSKCRGGGTACCSFDFNLEVDPVIFNANICPVMIKDKHVDVAPGHDQSIRCELDSVCITSCEWRNPQNEVCSFDRNTKYGEYCGSDVQFVGDFDQARCDIKIVGISGRHQGTWRCINQVHRTFSDTLNVTVTGALPLKSVLGISIPIGIVVILVVIFVIVWCICPSWIAACCCYCRKKGDEQKDRYKDGATQAGPQQQERRTRNNRWVTTIPEHHYEVSQGDQVPLPVPPTVTYTRVETHDGGNQPKTARKISNTTSLRNFNFGAGFKERSADNPAHKKSTLRKQHRL